MDLSKILAHQREFARERDWDRYHTPKNLSMALAGEAAELMEIFQWLSEAESGAVMKEAKRAESVRHELADVFYYLVRLADRLGVDLEAAFWEKMALNAKRYPAEKARGSAAKYTEYE